MPEIILASASPRRRELISLISDKVICTTSGVDEVIPDGTPVSDTALCLAKQKARSVAAQHPDSIVIGCDTTVLLEDNILGKPKDKTDARSMITALSGKTHKVITGCAIFYKDRYIGFSNVTEVEFYPLTTNEIEDYINTSEPYDKAGGYGIQGKASLFVKSIRGDYFNVVGLPVAELNRRLKLLIGE